MRAKAFFVMAVGLFRDHHICTQEDRPKNVPDCGAGLWFPVPVFRDRWRGGALSRLLTEQKARYCAGPFLLARCLAFARPIAQHVAAHVVVIFLSVSVAHHPLDIALATERG